MVPWEYQDITVCTVIYRYCFDQDVEQVLPLLGAGEELMRQGCATPISTTIVLRKKVDFLSPV